MRHKRVGFTLVELLVVIAIIGTLVALLLPAVQSARESARQNTCRNNIKQLQLALTSYDTQFKKLPGYTNELFNPNIEKDAKNLTPISGGRRASWTVMIFPYLEQNALWDKWSSEFSSTTSATPLAAQAPGIEGLVCPSDPPEIPGLPWTSYVGNAGQAFSDTTRTGTAVNVENPANGIFFDDNKNTNFGPTDGRETQNRLQMSLSYVQANDGTSKTFMISESLHVYYWCYDIVQSGPEWVQRATGSTVVDTKHLFGFVWKNPVPPSQPAPYERINGDRYFDQNKPPEMTSPANPLEGWSGETPEPGEPGYESYGYPSSNHPGGVNMAFCGGQIVFVTDQIDPLIYGQLMTSRRVTSALKSAQDVPERKLPPPPDDL